MSLVDAQVSLILITLTSLFLMLLFCSQTFETFLSGLSASEGRVSACLSAGKALIAENNPESGRIQVKLDETQQLWDDLKELAHARQEVTIFLYLLFCFDLIVLVQSSIFVLFLS